MIRRGLAAALSATLLAACGVHGQSEPQRVDADAVPFGLVDPAGGSARVPNAPQAMSLYFRGPHGMMQVTRHLATVATPVRALAALLDGPTESERAAGLASALVPATAARLEGIRGSIARVSLASGFRDSSIADQPAALAEIVYTLTALPGITRVQFAVDGTSVAVPRPDGSLAEAPVGRADYEEMLTDGGS